MKRMDNATLKNLLFYAVLLLTVIVLVFFVGKKKHGEAVTSEPAQRETDAAETVRFERVPRDVFLSALSSVDHVRAHWEDEEDRTFRLVYGEDRSGTVHVRFTTDEADRIDTVTLTFDRLKAIEKPKSEVEQRLAERYRLDLPKQNDALEAILTAVFDAVDLHGTLNDVTHQSWVDAARDVRDGGKETRDERDGIEFAAYLTSAENGESVIVTLTLP